MEQNQNGQQNKAEAMVSKTKAFFGTITNTQIGFAIGAVIIIIIIVLLVGRKSHAPVMEDNDSLVKAEDTMMTPPGTMVFTPKVVPVVETVVAPSMTYDQAVTTYKDARIQFSQTCQASPMQPTFKNGTEIMLDNRSSEIKTLAFDSTTYTIPAYGFEIVTLSAMTLPHTVFVDCNTSQNVTSILIQK